MTHNHRTPTRHGAVTAVVCLALATVVAAMASLNVALPSIARSTHADQTQLAWVIDAYSLTFAALLLPAGAIGDRYGRRLALIGGLAVFGAGSAIAMTASSAGELIALRAVLGAGAALVMPATLSTITSTFPAAQRARAVGTWAAVAGGSAILGLLASGLLLEQFSWRSVFGLNVALAAAALLGVLRRVPESADPDAPRLDVGGSLLAVVGLVALVYSVIEAPVAGWLAARTLAGLAAGLVGLVAFVAWELRTDAPLLDPRVFARPRLAAGSAGIFVQFFAFFGFVFVCLQYLQLERGDSPLLGAVSVLPMALTMMPTARLAPRLIDRFGARRVSIAGLVGVAAGLAVLAELTATSPYWLLAGGLVLLGAGMGAAMTPATSGITESLPAAQQGVGSALNDLSREVGGAIGIAVIGSVLDAVYRNRLDLGNVPAPVAAQARASYALATHHGGALAQRADTAFTSGIHAALLCGAGAALLAAVTVAVLLRGEREADVEPASEPAAV